MEEPVMLSPSDNGKEDVNSDDPNTPSPGENIKQNLSVSHNMFGDASPPVLRIFPQTLALNSLRGEIAQATQGVSVQTLENSTSPGRSGPLDENFQHAQNNLVLYETSAIKDPFRVECAERYILNGKSAIDMCQKNAEVAMELNMHSAALMWEISKLHCKILSSEGSLDPSKSSNRVMTTQPEDVQEKLNFSDEDLNNIPSSKVKNEGLPTDISSGVHMNQNLSATLDETYLKESGLDILVNQFNCTEVNHDQEFDLVVPIVKALHFHAMKGDVQTAVCGWLVLSPVCDLKIEIKTLHEWCCLYIELLERHRLYAEAALIIKLGYNLGLCDLSPENTIYLISCGECGGPMDTGSGNTCTKCKKAVTKCSICHDSVKGLLTWCQGCGHGGHSSHLDVWFSKHAECPVGCGHFCNFP